MGSEAWGWVVKLGDCERVTLECILLPFYHDSQKFSICCFFAVVVFWSFSLSAFEFAKPSTLLSYVFGRLCEFATLKPIAIPLVRPEKRLQDHLEGRIWLVYCITTIFAHWALNLTSTFYSLFLICNLNSRDTPPMNHAETDFPFRKLSFFICFPRFFDALQEEVDRQTFHGSDGSRPRPMISSFSRCHVRPGGRWDAGWRRIWIRGTVPVKHRNYVGNYRTII